MKITRATVEELSSVLPDLETAVSDITEPIEMWLDEDTDRQDRADAREQIETELDRLTEVCVEALKIDPKRLAS